MGVIGKIFGGGAKGPSPSEQAAQQDALAHSAEQRAEADRLAALSARISSRRQALKFREDRKAQLGG